MNPKTGLFKTRIRKHLRPKFAKEKQTILINDLLEKHYKVK